MKEAVRGESSRESLRIAVKCQIFNVGLWRLEVGGRRLEVVDLRVEEQVKILTAM